MNKSFMAGMAIGAALAFLAAQAIGYWYSRQPGHQHLCGES